MKYRIATFFLFIGILSFGQQVFMEIGRVSSQFDYESSSGETLDGSFPDANLSFAMGYRMEVANRFYLNGSATYNRYGTYGSISSRELRYDYQLDYLGINLGLEGEFYKKEGFTFYVRLAAEPQFMLSGTRTINDDVENIKGAEEFDSPFIFAIGGLGVNYCADKLFAVTMRYDYGLGAAFSSGDERLNYQTGTISLGILINLRQCKYCLLSKSLK